MHRLTQWAPTIDRFVQSPTLGLLAGAVVAAPLLLLSPHWALLPIFVWIVFLSFKIDRSLSNRMLVPPLAMLTLSSLSGLGIGVPLFIGSFSRSISPPHLIMQAVGLLGTPFCILGYVLGRGRVAPNWCPEVAEPVFSTLSRPLIRLGVFFAVFDLLRIFIGWRTGSLDRGYAGDVIIDQGIGIWTFANLFSRWTNLWFFFVPILWRCSGMLGRAALVGALVFYGLVAYASGSRGLMLYPIIFLFFGTYFFIDRPRLKPERWLLLLIPLFVFYIYAVDVFRNTQQFQNSRLTDLTSRLYASRAIGVEASEREDFALTTGRALIGVADNVIYESTPKEVPYAGGSDILPALLWTWVPQKLAPNKPLLFDANEIVVSYTNIRNERTASAISLGADCYRRFGWVGIPVGILLFGFVFGLFVRFVLYIVRRVSVVGGVALIVFLIGDIQNPFAVTLLQTWWIWAYDLPKHIVIMALVVFVVTFGENHGLDYYSGRNRFRCGPMPA